MVTKSGRDPTHSATWLYCPCEIRRIQPPDFPALFRFPCSEIWSGSSKVYSLTGTKFWEPALTNWTTFCITSDDNNNVVLYQNGVKFTQVQTSGTAKIPFVHRISNRIGMNNWPNVAGTNALIDELRIYDYALSAAEVKTLHDSKTVVED